MPPNRTKENKLSAGRLRQVLEYHPETGEFVWLMTRSRSAKPVARAGKLCRDGYRAICVDRMQFFEHRLVWLYVHGKWPSQFIDHINRNRSDNRIANLRDVSRAENDRNKTPRPLVVRPPAVVPVDGPRVQQRLAREALLTASDLREQVHYDPETGVFRRRGQTKQIGSVRTTGSYRWLYVNKRPYAAHRLAWLYVHGRWPPQFIDHVNCNPADNRLANLREASPRQNSANRASTVRPLKGITRNRGRWQAQIRCDGRNLYLGVFDTDVEAHAAYVTAARRVFGEFARAG